MEQTSENEPTILIQLSGDLSENILNQFKPKQETNKSFLEKVCNMRFQTMNNWMQI